LRRRRGTVRPPREYGKTLGRWTGPASGERDIYIYVSRDMDVSKRYMRNTQVIQRNLPPQIYSIGGGVFL